MSCHFWTCCSALGIGNYNLFFWRASIGKNMYLIKMTLVNPKSDVAVKASKIKIYKTMDMEDTNDPCVLHHPLHFTIRTSIKRNQNYKNISFFVYKMYFFKLWVVSLHWLSCVNSEEWQWEMEKERRGGIVTGDKGHAPVSIRRSWEHTVSEVLQLQIVKAVLWLICMLTLKCICVKKCDWTRPEHDQIITL